jgi:hypothetical protein
MRSFLFPAALSCLFFFAACNNAPKDPMDFKLPPPDTSIFEKAEKQANLEAQKIFADISTENLFRYFSGNFHLANLPCIYYDVKADKYIISGEGTFRKIPASKQKYALDAYHEFLRVRGYTPDGDSSKEAPRKKVDIKDFKMAEMLPEEKALFTPVQLDRLERTTRAYGFYYLANDRNCPMMFASYSGVTFQAKSLEKVFKMENAKDAFAAYSVYIDSIRKQ